MSTYSAKRKTLTFALVGVLALLLGLIGWMEFDGQTTDHNLNPNAKNITIQRNGHDDIALTLTIDGWHMTAPYALKANTQRIDPLLSLGSANFDGYEKSEVDLAATGLNQPGASLTIGQREFLFGDADVSDERRYALVDNKVSFVPSWVWSLVHGGVTAFADLTVFNELPTELFLVAENETRKLDNIEQWRGLQADKIAQWPDTTALSIEERNRIISWQLSTSDKLDSNGVVANLLRMEDRTLINTKPGFAFVISNARFDALLDR